MTENCTNPTENCVKTRKEQNQHFKNQHFEYIVQDGYMSWRTKHTSYANEARKYDITKIANNTNKSYQYRILQEDVPIQPTTQAKQKLKWLFD